MGFLKTFRDEMKDRFKGVKFFSSSLLDLEGPMTTAGGLAGFAGASVVGTAAMLGLFFVLPAALPATIAATAGVVTALGVAVVALYPSIRTGQMIGYTIDSLAAATKHGIRSARHADYQSPAQRYAEQQREDAAFRASRAAAAERSTPAGQPMAPALAKAFNPATAAGAAPAAIPAAAPQARPVFQP